ncbi:similar to Saccharomyces cerevisiae YJL154C VPS35 Endosomal subunit of membrane-associated retromer complex required for retrograde transport [Maudiozyma saulgeensis]|uniref:Vacuolar protein sorting-associated protein 35 n=1 Tax=Maudiozyma saulgeensis TaxID=1789683 RepID=A0A1X7R0V0_9SACH|nr:similar to Saccharomyces cerevisiae YJL154C VPS35 Endosomal subunit of membrane-associated retromer complex required for retrograde transport [Kazachstania saulgeensis]
MSYSESVEQAISNIKQQTVLMQRSLNNRKLMDALKFTSTMLTELRNPRLLPKQYYELYIQIFDSLTILSAYLVENHSNGHHLADLYELVQYAGNVVPRLYLMITVGTSYLKIPESPREEILKDMIEMCRGVQNPIRGLFLRYYLSQRTKQLLLPEDDKDSIEFNSQFIITNFIEMNKLWVRLQHQGPLRERDQRTKERKELQILVGSQLVRLSQVVDDNLKLYKIEILPILLEQIVQCRDVVCQEYLYDVICQVFPDEFHLKTLDSLLDTSLQLSTEVSVTKIILTLITRLNGYIERVQQENENRDESNNIFQRFWKHLLKLNEERPDLSIQELSGIILGIMNLSLTWYPDNIENLNRLFSLVAQKCKDFGEEKTSESESFMVDLLTAQKLEVVKDFPIYYFNLITQCESFRTLLTLQSSSSQMEVLTKIIDSFLGRLMGTKQQTRNKDGDKSQLLITSKTQLERFLAVLEPMITHKDTKKENDEGNDTISREFTLSIYQEKLTKICHFLMLSLDKSTFKTIESEIELLLMIKNVFHKGGKNIKFTYPAIITNFWRMIRKCNIYKKRIPKKQIYYDNLIKQNFKYISRCINDMFNNCGKNSVDTIYKLNLQNAALADQLSLVDISYDFFSEAFSVFEESLSDSKTQFQALIYMAQTLQKTRSLYKENYYNSLIVRTTLHGSKLLKKQDQCRAVYICSHLWWATEISSVGEEEGETTDFFREGKRVLECLQRSLRAADSRMDNVESCELMVEILNVCLYYFVHGDEQTTHVGVSYINGLIELIKNNLKSLRLEEEQRLSEIDTTKIDSDNETNTSPYNKYNYVMGLDGTYIKLGNVNNSSSANIDFKVKDMKINDMIQIPIKHFDRTCEYILNQRDIDNRFKTVVI